MQQTEKSTIAIVQVFAVSAIHQFVSRMRFVPRIFMVWSIFNLGCKTKSVIIWWIFLNRVQSVPERYEQVLFSGFSSPFSLLLLLSRFVWNVRWRQSRRSSGGGGVVVGIRIWSFIWSNRCRRAYLEFKNNDQNKWKLRVFSFILMWVLLGQLKKLQDVVCIPHVQFINIIISSFVFIPTDENSSFENCHFFFASFSLFLFGIEFCRSLLLIENLIFLYSLKSVRIWRWWGHCETQISIKCCICDYNNPLQIVCVRVCAYVLRASMWWVCVCIRRELNKSLFDFIFTIIFSLSFSLTLILSELTLPTSSLLFLIAWSFLI